MELENNNSSSREDNLIVPVPLTIEGVTERTNSRYLLRSSPDIDLIENFLSDSQYQSTVLNSSKELKRVF